MINIVLDANIYKANPNRNDLNFKSIEKLSKMSYLKLHVPYIVQREFQTQQSKLCSDDLTKIISGFNSLSRKQLSQEIIKKINKIKSEIESDKAKILEDSEKQFIKWLDSINANRHPLCLEQANNAMEAYFQGKAPFKEPKIRKDIPDSFIVQSIYKLCEENDNMHIVTEDIKIRNSFVESETIKIYEKLSDFISSKLIQDKLIEIDLKEKIELIKQLVSKFENDFYEISMHISNQIGENLIDKTFNDYTILDDNHEATISGFYDPENIELLFDEMNYYGNGEFGIPFSLQINVVAYYYIFKSDYYISDDHSPSISDLNDHYFEAEDEFYVSVDGIISLHIDVENINLDEFEKSINIDSINIDDITNIERC